MRYRFPHRMPSTASVRFRPICLIHNSFAVAAMPAISTLRVDSSMKNNTTNRWRPFRVHTSTVKKSAATISSQCHVNISKIFKPEELNMDAAVEALYALLGEPSSVQPIDARSRFQRHVEAEGAGPKPGSSE